MTLAVSETRGYMVDQSCAGNEGGTYLERVRVELPRLVLDVGPLDDRLRRRLIPCIPLHQLCSSHDTPRTFEKGRQKDPTCLTDHPTLASDADGRANVVASHHPRGDVRRAEGRDGGSGAGLELVLEHDQTEEA